MATLITTVHSDRRLWQKRTVFFCRDIQTVQLLLGRSMAHALVIVVGDDWEALMQPHCIHKEDGTEGEGQFDWCEQSGHFGKPLKFLKPQSRGGLLRFFSAITHTAQARRSQIDIESLREQFAFAVVSDGQWQEPESFEDARKLIETAGGDPLITAVDYHL